MKKVERKYDELLETYGDMYEAEICKERQLPDFRDGMRIVQRRLFWVFLNMSKEKRTHLQKSASIIGDALKYHSHGDGTVYGSLVSEVNSVASLLKGKGNWGSKTSSIACLAAAMRYTEVAMRPSAEEYFKYAQYSDMVTGEIGLMEPAFIPVPFPYALLNGFFGITKSGRCQVPSYHVKDLYERLLFLLGKGPEKIIKPYFGLTLKMEGEFQNILTQGVGKVKVYPNLVIDEPKGLIEIKEICPDITNLGSILESISSNKKYNKYITIKDVSGKKNDIIITYSSKYMKNVSVTFKHVVEFIKTKLTAKISYNNMVYRGYKDYPTVSVDSWLLDNFSRVKNFRKIELDRIIASLQDKLSLSEAILKARPLIQKWLQDYKKFTKEIIDKLKEAISNLLGDPQLASKVMSISITKLLETEIDIDAIKKDIADTKAINNDENHSKDILKWLSELKQEVPR